MKLNFKIRSCELDALYILTDTHDRTLGGLIRSLAFDQKAGLLRAALGRLLKGKEKESGTRIPVTLKLSKTETSALKASTPRNHTYAETLREMIGLRPISYWFVPAARASSRRGNRPVITPESINEYFDFLEARARATKAMEGTLS